MEKNRKPAVAGQFYPKDAAVLKTQVYDFLKPAKSSLSDVVAVISPHAGYVYSGSIAAQAIKQLDPTKKYENVFIIGLSHHKHLKGAAVYGSGDFEMPGFVVKVNTQITTQLTETCKYIEIDEQAHSLEHSIEVQLPFIQYHLQTDYKIVPILIGTSDIATIEAISEALLPYFNFNNVFVISTDFSHYPSYKDAKIIDSITANAILENNVEKFLNTLAQNEEKNIPYLGTSACNWSGIACLLYMTQKNANCKFQIIKYQNSGDSRYGDYSQVVGYYAIGVCQTK